MSEALGRKCTDLRTWRRPGIPGSEQGEGSCRATDVMAPRVWCLCATRTWASQLTREPCRGTCDSLPGQGPSLCRVEERLNGQEEKQTLGGNWGLAGRQEALRLEAAVGG